MVSATESCATNQNGKINKREKNKSGSNKKRDVGQPTNSLTGQWVMLIHTLKKEKGSKGP